MIVPLNAEVVRLTYSIYQSPGRLQVRTPIVKGDKIVAQAVKRLVSNVAGVTSVRSSHRSGRVTVGYDSRATSGGKLINQLVALGVIDDGIIGFPCRLQCKTRPSPSVA